LAQILNILSYAEDVLKMFLEVVKQEVLRNEKIKFKSWRKVLPDIHW